MAFRTRIVPFLYPAFTAVVMVLLVRSGLLTPLFLLPLGLLGQRERKGEVFLAILLMVLINGGLSIGALRTDPSAWKLIAADTLYVSALALIFAILLIPGVALRVFPSNFRGTYRVLLASVIGTLFLLPLMLLSMYDEGVAGLFKKQAEAIASMLTEMSQDTVQGTISADIVLELLKSVALRGGFFVSHLMLFGFSAFLSRQGSNYRWVLSNFHVDFNMIWFFSCFLLAILAGYVFNIPILEIAGWNGALSLALLYFLQGLGIVFFNLSHPMISRSGRFLLRTLLLVLLISPGINAIVLTGIFLLGVAENWVSLRRPHITGPSSTPGM